MNIQDVISRIGEIGVIPVLRAESVDQAFHAVEAIALGGIPVVEVTMTVPDAPAVIRKVVERFGNHVLTGAGTVLTAAQADACLNAGAEFLVSPGLSLPVLEVARTRGKLAIPGALTPTEIMHAISEQCRVIKIFPAGSVGGAKYLKALSGPFPNLALIPTGGVNFSNVAEYLTAGAFAIGAGSDLIDPAALRSGDYLRISQAARELIEAIRRWRVQRETKEALAHP
jgi:2-dehydro-3-deoxyphosphogluconate aldolase/(4S)-4-hydroxy-2-oxoglutarate aldolase